jgi:tetratricopeptide (TPR) repeat protein
VGIGGILWWYVQPESNKAAIANYSKKADTANIVNSNRNEHGQGDVTEKEIEPPKKVLDKAEQQQLYAQNFVPDAPPQQETELLEGAFAYYKKGSYKQASLAYEKIQREVESLTTRTLEDEADAAESKRIMFYAHYYNALSYMAVGNTNRAIRELRAIKESPDRYWQSKQQWYLALAYLKTGEAAKAITWLQQVASNNEAGEYRQKAIQLIKALKEE